MPCNQQRDTPKKERLKAERTQHCEAWETAAEAACVARGPIVAFGGSLGNKSKPDLLELADAPGVSLEDACNNQERIERIQSHLDSHLNLKENPRFTGLYLRVTHGQKRAHAVLTTGANFNENEPPQSHSEISEPQN